MSETTYFWQGGRKIEIQKDDSAITIHADDEVEARAAAARAGVEREFLWKLGLGAS